jgi:Dullard-like phosphatase family protein
MIHYFEELIDINNAMDDRNLLKTLLNNFNQNYFLNNENYNKNEYNLFFKENENFEYIFKHFGLVLICLIFFAKDNLLFNEYNSKVKELFLQLIYSSLNYVEIDGNRSTKKINIFINDNNSQSVISIHRYIFTLICLLFDSKKDYFPLRNALEQLYETITKKDYLYLTEVINNSILYCYNTRPKCLFSFSIFRSKNNILTMRESPELQNNNSYSNNTVTTENLPSIPFIKSSMKKKFCLVLDIDETISHSLKLSFGCYFLVRPGALDFLKEVSKYYEIIIFTSSPKSYADKILNKIDINGNLISHRLYRNHVIYENGKSAKNLNMIGRDLTKTIFIDNLMSNAKYNLNNLCPITTWISDIFDDKLIKLKNKLIYIATSGKYDNDITQGL